MDTVLQGLGFRVHSTIITGVQLYTVMQGFCISKSLRARRGVNGLQADCMEAFTLPKNDMESSRARLRGNWS